MTLLAKKEGEIVNPWEKQMSNIKPVFKCKDIEKQAFKHSKCLLTISVGQEVHEGEKFIATLELVNSSFASCIMLIDDSLQRHSMALDTKEDASSFYNQSIHEGDLWLERNRKYYKNLSILDNIIRWDKWLYHPNYAETEKKIKGLINEDANYKLAFVNTVDEFLRRYYQRLIEKVNFDMERARSLCMNYLLEECTALCLWPELGCHFEVYPSKRNLAMDETHKRFVLPGYPGLLHSVAIKFKNRKQLKPQQFKCKEEVF